MKKIILRGSILLLIVVSLFGFTYKHNKEIRKEFKKYYDQYEVKGSFLLYDQNHSKFIIYNPSKIKKAFTPASTFKICNSLIGIETGVIKDEDFVIPWDSIKRLNPNWNRESSLQTAFKNSTVWYYQELARRVGEESMKFWLKKAQYGNASISGGIDKFWLSGGLRISMEQQIAFLKKLHDNNLPFSERTMEIVKKIMTVKVTAEYVIKAKTGWGEQDGKNIGWYVGYIETQDNVYYFANCIQTARDVENSMFAKARVEIAYQILSDLKILQN